MRKIGKYLTNLALSVDQLFNAIFAGDPDETISSRIGKKPNHWISKLLCPLLHLLDKNHCRDAKELDEGKDDVWKL